MDCNNGHLYELTDAEVKQYRDSLMVERDGKRLVPLTEKQHEDVKPMEPARRKGYMRNQPCVCGSGVKFKRCCWSKYA